MNLSFSLIAFARFRTALLVALLGLVSMSAVAQEAAIRKNLAERLPTAFTKIDEVSKTPMAGIWEVRINTSEIFYTDAEGNFLVQGSMFDTRAKKNLTEEREAKLSAIEFSTLPLKDAFTIVRGNGKRKMAVFEDPNCGYCKRFERDMLNIDNVTVHLFLLPILGPDSLEKSKNVWCAADKGKAWLDLMVRDQNIPAAKAPCDASALERNVAFSKKHRITGTPTIFYADGSRVPGAVPAEQVEKQLQAAKN